MGRSDSWAVYFNEDNGLWKWDAQIGNHAALSGHASTKGEAEIQAQRALRGLATDLASRERLTNEEYDQIDGHA